VEETHHEVELVGGPQDGRRLCVRAAENELAFPVMMQVTADVDLDAKVTYAPDPPMWLYRWDGTFRDDGVRVFPGVFRAGG
jgi:hypothetical protein